MDQEGLKNSALFRWRLARASHVNPIDALLKSDQRKANTGEDVASLFTALIALVATAAGGFALYYVSKQSQGFGSAKKTLLDGVVSINKSETASLDTHYVCIPDVNGNINVTLPDATTLDLGRWVSASLPIALIPEATTDTRTARILWTGHVFSLPQNGGALFMVSLELGLRKWKLVRQWPTDQKYTAGIL